MKCDLCSRDIHGNYYADNENNVYLCTGCYDGCTEPDASVQVIPEKWHLVETH